jgi:hypothetical protein
MAIQLLNFIYNKISFHYLRYLYRRCVELGKSGMYGFLDPYYNLGQNDQVSVQTYIQNTMDHNKKVLYLAP